MSVTPDIAGYRDALLRKREAMSSEVTFIFPNRLNYPEGTVLNAEGRPYDPQIKPVSESHTGDHSMQLSVAFKPVKRGGGASDSEESEWGDMKVNYALTWMTLEEWESLVEPPVSFDYAGDHYIIRKATEESIAGAPWRMLIWGEREGPA